MAPPRFEDVLGQQAVTARSRSPQSGHWRRLCLCRPRGCGKTTTRVARQALTAFTADAELRCLRRASRSRKGRHRRARNDAPPTGVTTYGGHHRGLSIVPSAIATRSFMTKCTCCSSSFNARLKSIETAAACDLHDGDNRAAQDSRNRVVAIAGLRVPHHLVETLPNGCASSPRRRDSEPRRGSPALPRRRRPMRILLSALDQVRAFAGDTSRRRFVTVLGLVGLDSCSIRSKRSSPRWPARSRSSRAD